MFRKEEKGKEMKKATSMKEASKEAHKLAQKLRKQGATGEIIIPLVWEDKGYKP